MHCIKVMHLLKTLELVTKICYTNTGDLSYEVFLISGRYGWNIIK